MIDFLKKLFNFNSNENQSPLPLTHPRDLKAGDIIKFGFLPQSGLSNQRFTINSINSYEFSDEMSASLTLKGEDNSRLWLGITSEDGNEYLSISKALTRKEIKSLFNPDHFSAIFEEGAGMRLERINCPEGLSEWTKEIYTEVEDCAKGHYHKGDYRLSVSSAFNPKGIELDYYLLQDDSEEFSIEIEVYKDGDTEVSATTYHDLSAITEMWRAD